MISSGKIPENQRPAAVVRIYSNIIVWVVASLRVVFGSLTLSADRQGCALSHGLAHPYERVTLFSVKGTGRAFIRMVLLIFFSLLMLATMIVPSYSAVAGTDILNTATASYSIGGVGGFTKDSNAVTTTTVALRTDSVIVFEKYTPGVSGATATSIVTTDYSTDGTTATMTPLADPEEVDGTSIPMPGTYDLLVGSLFHKGEAFFVEVTDIDQNLDPATAETIFITITTSDGDSELLRITETGVDTGVFVGYIQSVSLTTVPVVGNDGLLSVDNESAVTATYTDPLDGADVSIAGVLVDPYGIVFDSSTGLPIDGVTVELLNGDLTPATVYADDGISAFPNVLTTGDVFYSLPPGGFRFPFVAPGDYILLVTAPAGYSAPSIVSTAVIQALPGAPFAMANPGSRGEVFTINPGPAVHIDIPIDSLFADLYTRKVASKSIVGVGDFIQYKISVQNSGAVVVPAVTAVDLMPLGFNYVSGSTRIDGADAIDPLISADGRTLTFALGDIIPGDTVEITYVVEVSAGVSLGDVTNTAYATNGIITSNMAEATVLVREEFFRSKNILMGYVSRGGCGEDTTEREGVEGVKIYLENGAFVVSDMRGMFHFDGVRPGSHVVQLDIDSLPEGMSVVACEKNTRFAGRAFSQFVDLKGGTMWRTDFYLTGGDLTGDKLAAEKEDDAPKPAIVKELKGTAGIGLLSSIKDTNIDYRIPVKLGGVPLSNLRLSVMLPDGVEYVADSSSLNNESIEDPSDMFDTLTYRLGELDTDFDGELILSVNVKDATKEELKTNALLTFDTPSDKNQRTPVVLNVLDTLSREERTRLPEIVVRPHFEVLGADLSANDKFAIDKVVEGLLGAEIIKIYVAGHTDTTRIKPENRVKFADNYALSLARANIIAHYVGDLLGVPPERLVVSGKGADSPIADNKTDAGRAENRRVELRLLTERVVKSYTSGTKADKAEMLTIETLWKIPTEVEDGLEDTTEESRMSDARDKTLVPEEEHRSIAPMPSYESDEIDSMAKGFEWMWPVADHYPSIDMVHMVIKHNPKNKLKLFVNQREVSPLNYDGRLKNKDNTVSLSFWRAVQVIEGDNLIEAVEFDKDGNELGRITRTMHYSSMPVKGKYVEELSTLKADGKSTPTIAVRLFDKDGHPARMDSTIEFWVDPPYMSLQKFEALRDEPLNGIETNRIVARVGSDGIARIELAPTASPGEVVVHLRLIDEVKEIRAWIEPELREWILVGMAEGTYAYKTISKSMTSAETLGDGEEDFYEDGKVSFYAKGRIKGSWLLTAAYDSEKKSSDGSGGMFQTIDPNTYYTIYGDGTRQLYDATSARKLYLKIERKEFYALFGDYDTGLTVTELARYSRRMNGVKTELRGEHLGFSAFASDTSQAFVKDEMLGDGTSGLYGLSRSDIISNSESVSIEVRDRFRSEIVISSTRLSRHIDYDIDYDNATIFFKSPVPSKDGDLNPVYIVVDYESNDSADKAYNYGGRVSVKSSEDRAELGLSHIHEGAIGGEGDLYGLDARLDITEATQLKAELATSDSDFAGTDRDGTAYLAELTHKGEKLDGNLYVREQRVGFGLGQQKGSESGTRKIGSAVAYKLGERVKVEGKVYRQTNLNTDAERDFVESRVSLRESSYSLYAGLRRIADSFSDGTNRDSNQLTLGAKVKTFGSKLSLTFDREQSIGSQDKNSDFPTRTIFGVDYKFSDKVSLFATHEITSGESEDTDTTTFGMKAAPWEGGTLTSSTKRVSGENGEEMFSSLGLTQKWRVNERWSVDASLDRGATLEHPGATPFNTNVPLASGAGKDFTAATLGTNYKAESWSFATRAEARSSAVEDKWSIMGGVYGEVREGLALSLSTSYAKSDLATGVEKSKGVIGLGLAHRPELKSNTEDSKWIILDKLEFITENERGGVFNFNEWRIVNNLNANYKPSTKTELSIQYGAKFVQENIDGNNYSGYTDLIGLEGRYDITEKIDIGVRTSVLHSWESDTVEYGAGVSVGYNLFENVWVSLGFNLAGYSDSDFSAGEYTEQGAFFKFRLKFDQKTVKDALKSIGGE